MRLVNGIIFGSGMGLLTIGALELGNDHTTTIISIGTLLILTEAARLLARACRKS